MTESLILAVDDAPPLADPVLLVALGGWFDAAGVATSALRLIAADSNSVVVGGIDPDRFYDFSVVRPTIEFLDGERQITWPETVFRAVRTPGQGRYRTANRSGWRSRCCWCRTRSYCSWTSRSQA